MFSAQKPLLRMPMANLMELLGLSRLIATPIPYFPWISRFPHSDILGFLPDTKKKKCIGE
jgi:hypothetical protein